MQIDNAANLQKWGPILEHAECAPIRDTHRRNVTAQLLENTHKAIMEGNDQNGQSNLNETTNIGDFNGGIKGYDPVLISLIRRTMPNLIAYDICGVQPMSGPTGLIFAMQPKYGANTAATNAYAFFNEANTGFTTLPGTANTVGAGQVGTIPGVANNVGANTFNTGSAFPTANAEALTGAAWPEMTFGIDKVSVVAKTRALKAEYTMELAQDLRAIHGLEAETELANMLTTEVLAEINREVVRTVVITAVTGAAANTTTVGRFDLDLDANGRWSVEKFKGLMFQIEREANAIAITTRRGKGNLIICSSDVASALQMAGVLDYTPALASNNLQVDDTGNTFAGVLNGRYKVYVDPYAGGNYVVVGYKGGNSMDSGLFYCPYVPMQMVRALDDQSMQPKIGFKTRYGMVANPFCRGAVAADGTLVQDTNFYYRRVLVDNLM